MPDVLDVDVKVRHVRAMPAAAASNAALAPIPPRPDRERFSITDLCEEFGVTARALRFYEDEGLIAPAREGMARIYSHRDRARLAWILRGKRVGFSLAEIREMIDLYDVGEGRELQRKVTIERCHDRIELLREQRRDIDAAIAELEGFVDVLDTAETSETPETE